LINLTVERIRELSTGAKITNLDAIEYHRFPTSMATRSYRYIVSPCDHALGYLAHHFLHAATGGVVGFTT
jgi:hypothetical protein